MIKQDWEYQIGYLSEAVREFGYEIVEQTDTEDRVEHQERVVYINSRSHPETRFYTLLHEYGHIEISETAAVEFAADHPMYIHADDGRSARTSAYKVSLLAEEIEAWKRGRWFARNESLYVDDVKYDKNMTDCVMSYIDWAATSSRNSSKGSTADATVEV